MTQKMIKIFTISALLIASSCIAADPFKDLPKLSLSAKATISKPADMLQLSIGVITLKDTAEEALAENSSKMQSVIAALEKVGITKAEYKTGNFSIHPSYSPYPKDPPKNWKPAIVGYEVRNSLSIQTQQLKTAGKLIDAASKAGANSIENIHFGLRDTRMHWNEAISKATTNAANDAQVIADAAQVKIVRPLSITLENEQTIVPRNVGYAKMMSAEASPPIEAGDIEITASINVVYEIK